MDLSLFALVELFAVAFLALMLFLALFEQPLPYRIAAHTSDPSDAPELADTLAAVVGANLRGGNQVEVLTDGSCFYEAELAAIAAARHSVNLEAYIFQKGELTRRFLAALAERARSGVAVRLVLDAVGSFATWSSYFEELRAAGGRVHFYHPIRWYTLPRINNRTHRELIVVDGRVGFVGGAGFADQWLLPHGRGRRKRPWRDTMFRIEGPVVRDLQSVFVENWLEASGELLSERTSFPPLEPRGNVTAFVVGGTPTTGRSTRNRMLYQTLLASARSSIHVTTPYFLPDKNVRHELIRAIQRGAEVTIVTPGPHTDHLLTRRSSRRLYGALLRAGARIFEFQPAMIHTKSMVVDALWSVVGSTNLDSRSFGINDEVNVAVRDAQVARRLEQDFARDIAQSRAVSYRKWYRRPAFERVWEWLGALLERQQ